MSIIEFNTAKISVNHLEKIKCDKFELILKNHF